MMLDIMVAFRLLFLSILTLLVAGGAPPVRQITIDNNCTVPAWTFITPGAAGACATGCPTGSTCKGTGNCMWDNPTPSTGNYRIDAKSKNIFTFASSANDPNLPPSMWNGNFAFCKQGTDCNQSPTVCDSVGCGPNGPSSVAEFNIMKNGTDYFDISLIAGVSISMQISPDAAHSTASGSPYTCASLGSPQPSASGLGPSSWSFSPPPNSTNSIDYKWVTPSSTPPTQCSKDQDCTKAGEVCGLVLGLGTTTLTNVCGVLSGYWTPNAVCAASPGTSHFNCSDKELTSYIQCAGDAANSCYASDASDACCGCVNWDQKLTANLVPSATQKCTNSNPYWIDNVLPGVMMIKEGCPNCYGFPFDDMSSTSTCMTEENGYNVQNYTITLCPNGPFPS